MRLFASLGHYVATREADHPEASLADFEIDATAPLASRWDGDSLEGVAVPRTSGFRAETAPWHGRLYRPAPVRSSAVPPASRADGHSLLRLGGSGTGSDARVDPAWTGRRLIACHPERSSASARRHDIPPAFLMTCYTSRILLDSTVPERWIESGLASDSVFRVSGVRTGCGRG